MSVPNLMSPQPSSARKRKPVEQDELNTKTFKMADLIAWRPKEENQLRKKWNDKRNEQKEREANDASARASTSQQAKPTVAAPRVKLDEKGEIVIDTESLVITERPEDSSWTTVHEDFMPKKLNSMSFKKNLSIRSIGWSSDETDFFYYILNATGPDFSLMHDFFPTRTRAELKKKYKKEERSNPARVNETLMKPAMLDDKLRLKAKEMLEKIENEKRELAEKKKEKKLKGAADDTQSVTAESVVDCSESMGVPAFFRWLSRKYPSIVVNAVEERHTDDNGKEIPVDSTQPNPNFQEFDSLYLDMNGIIHPCTHPEDRPAPKNEEEMFTLIFEYIDRLFAIVRPRKLLYMAIDGVAPRAKMNQQRSRRFRASKEAAEKQEEILSIRNELENQGVPLPPPKAKEEHFDSNCITPGTPFMARLAVALRHFVHLRITNDPAWRNIVVILSDANVPGEGEHKIMDFVRRQRASPSHDPNTVHCLCGADADLIMLGLATHEVNFNILREEFLPNRPRPCELCFQYGHDLKDCQGLLSKTDNPDVVDVYSKHTNFIFIRLPVLREYLQRDLAMHNLPFQYDFERAIDDWVFMCFFVGNDFLPHLPSLEIREGAIDRLIKLYKNVVYTTKGWLTDNGNVFIHRVEMIMKELGRVEDEIFRTRQERELRFRANQKRRRLDENKTRKPAFLPQSSSVIAPHAPSDGKQAYVSGADVRKQLAEQRRTGMQTEQAHQILNQLFTPVAGKKRSLAEGDEDEPKSKSFKAGHLDSSGSWREVTRDTRSFNSTLNTTGAENAGDDSEPEDTIRLWEDGWKDRYYRQKFNVPESDMSFRRKVAWAYTEGLCWVLKYYYQGCASWDWYYPYHYAPFASDFSDISKFRPDWSKLTKPFSPLEQLMGVFPAASRMHVPEGWRDFMTSPESPIFQFYPTSFEVDLNGKKFAWQGVALLPFVCKDTLLKTLKTSYDSLTADEIQRNVTSFDFLFISRHHKMYVVLSKIKSSEWVKFGPGKGYGICGSVCSVQKSDNATDGCLELHYQNPQEDDTQFSVARLEGSKTPERVLKSNNYNDRQNGQYRPTTGFTKNVPQATLSDTGHRILRHETSDNQRRDNRPAPYHRNPSNGNSGPRHNQQGKYDQRTFYNKNYQQQGNSRQADNRGSGNFVGTGRNVGSYPQQRPNQPFYGQVQQPPMLSFSQLALYGAPPSIPPTFNVPPPSIQQFNPNIAPTAQNSNGNGQQGEGDSANQVISQVPSNLYGAPPPGSYQGFFG